MAVPDWDRHWSDSEDIRAAAEQVRSAWRSDPARTERDCPRSSNLLIARSASHPHYERGGTAERRGYGRGRRSITNLEDASAALQGERIEHDLYEPGRHSLGCQIASFGGATAVLGIRGAEWANMTWAPQEARALILDPSPPARTIRGCLDRLGLRGDLVEVPSHHVAVDPRLAVAFFRGS